MQNSASNLEKTQANIAGTAAKPKSLAEFVKEGSTQDINASTKFDPDFDKVFEELGAQANKKNPGIDAATIKLNFIKTLKQGKSLEEAFDYLKTQNCQTAAIIKGLICFFAGEVGANEISLEDFLQPREAKIGGDETLTQKYLILRQKFLGETMEALASIRGGLPEIPNKQV